jgi:hypothetical protein
MINIEFLINIPSPCDCFVYHSYFRLVYPASILTIIALLDFDLQLPLSVNPNVTHFNPEYAHIFTDTENAVTKNIDGKYQVSFLPYPAGLLVNDTSTKLNFSVMENNTDVPFLFTSLVITDKNTGSVVERSQYKFHEFGNVPIHISSESMVNTM